MKQTTFKDTKQEAALFSRRCYAIFAIVCLFCLIIFGRLIYLQVIKAKTYTTLSEHNMLNIIPVAPTRGLIYDRNGVLLAKNIPVFSLDIIPGDVKNLDATLNALQSLLSLTPQDLADFHRALRRHHRYDPIPLKYKLTEQQIALFYVNQFRFPGVLIETHMLRQYPLGPVMSDILGYVGRINERDLKHIDRENYAASNYIGKVGIEKYDEALLHGKTGAALVEINASGRSVHTLKRIAPTPGKNLTLTIDSKLQAFAEKALGDNAGAIVVIQPSTGQILAMANKPNYDPNPFVTGLSTKAYQALINAEDHPLYNRSIRGLYSPGSTIKVFQALGGLQNQLITPDYTIYDQGWYRVPNTQHIFHDWKPGGHGTVNLRKAITESCDTYFYKLANNMGIHRMDDFLTQFGFGQLTGIEMSEELPGIVPSPAWKRKVQGSNWFTGDTINIGIGQGALVVTPLQLANATAILAEHGAGFQPHLTLHWSDANGAITQFAPIPLKPILLDNPDNWDLIIQDMENVINSYLGTAHRYGPHRGYAVAAKTGTAQVYGKQRDEERSRSNLPKKLRNNHLFIEIAPADHPQIVLAVVVEHAAHEDEIAGKVTRFYFHEK